MGDTGRSVERKRSDPYSARNTLGYQYIVLEVGGKIYTSPLPSSLQLQSGKQSELAISFIPTEDVLVSKSRRGNKVGKMVIQGSPGPKSSIIMWMCRNWHLMIRRCIKC